jgi:hypothetical protein
MASIYTSDAGIIQSLWNDTSSKVELAIHNQFSGIELTSPVYEGDSITCYLSPDQRVVVGSAMQAGFSIHPARVESIGVFMCKLQKKNTDQSNDNITSSEEEAICTRLIFIWKIYKLLGKFQMYSDLIDYDKRRVWDRDGIMKLATRYKLHDVKYCPIEHTWLIHDNVVLRTRLNVTHKKSYYKIEMTISEESLKDYTIKPRYIGLDR